MITEICICVLVVVLLSTVLGVAACMLSSRISRELGE